jgi:hypothetical protein
VVGFDFSLIVALLHYIQGVVEPAHNYGVNFPRSSTATGFILGARQFMPFVMVFAASASMAQSQFQQRLEAPNGKPLTSTPTPTLFYTLPILYYYSLPKDL